MRTGTERRFSGLASQDAIAGLLFLCLGGGACAYALASYRLGTAASMGPGYFPALVGGVVALLGLGILVSALRKSARGDAAAEGEAEPFGLGALVAVLAAILGFALLLRPLGLFASLAVLVVISRLARRGTVLEMVVLTAVLSAIAYVIFVVGLRMPFRLVPW